MNILITGGTGYIGSHTGLLLAQEGHHVVLFDDLSNSTSAVLKRLALLGAEHIVFEQGNVRTSATLAPCLIEHDIEAVIHLAGAKGPSESVNRPLDFHSQHQLTTFNLLGAMGVMARPLLINGSSGAVYGQAPRQPLAEHQPTAAQSPYASAHRYAETTLCDVTTSDPTWSVCNLRIFNVAGAHPSGLLGEEMGSTTVGLTTHLARVAAGHSLAVYLNGHQLDTPDGSPQRDFVHVMDVAQAIVDALAYAMPRNGFDIFNVGSGTSHSVLHLVRAFEDLSHQDILVLPGEAGLGQPDHSRACLEKTRFLLGWEPTHSLQDICQSTWNHLLTAIETGAQSHARRSVSR